VSRHTATREARHTVGRVPSADANHVALVSGAEDAAPHRAIVAHRTDDNDAIRGELVDLIREGPISVVGTTDGEIQYVDFEEQRIVEGIQEPASVRHLRRRKHAKCIQVAIGRKAWTFSIRPRDNPRDKGPMADGIIAGGIGGPVRSTDDVADMWMIPNDTSIKHRDILHD
jgi:hypothetical protein